MAIDPVSLYLGAGQFGMSLWGSYQDKQAQKQDYLNQTAFQDATSEFNVWQANQNAAIQDLNSDYNYWAKTVQYNNNFAQVQSNRNYELARELAQAEVVTQTRAGAQADYMVNADAIREQLRERGIQESMAIMQQKRRALQSSAAVQAMGMGGESLERFERDFAFQVGEYTAISQINEGIRNRQYKREQYGLIAQYLSKYNSQTFYEPQHYIDPIQPFAPLPTLVNPPPPSMRGAKPANTSLLDVGTAAFKGVNTYFANV